MSTERVVAQVRKWRDELIDLTRRNRLLNLSKSKSSSLRIVDPGYGQILRDLHGARGWRFHYPPLDAEESADSTLVAAIEAEDTELTDTREPDELMTDTPRSRDISRILRNLERRGAQEYLDRGLRVLYLAIGLLEWTDEAGEQWHSPLVLVPVSINRPNPRAPFRLAGTDDDAIVNPALAVKLEDEYQITLPKISDEADVSTVLAEIRRRVAGQSGWKVTDQVDLTFFSFQKEVMYQDLKDNESTISEHVIVEALSLGPSAERDLSFGMIDEAQIDEVVPPEQLVSILDADATQRQCIVAARQGKSFVMDGPPGSGKSQTIANMIAELIAADRSVLFVSEKAAALEVVKSRLDKAGLGSFVLELHSHKATRKEVATVLDAALRERPRLPSGVTTTELAEVERRRHQLTSYSTALNEQRAPLGRSLHHVLGECLLLGDQGRAPLPDSVGADLLPQTEAAIGEAANRLASAWGPVDRRDDFLWRDLRDPQASLRAQVELERIVRTLGDRLQQLTEHARAVALELGIETPTTLIDVGRLIQVQEHLETRPVVPVAWLTAVTLDSTIALITERRSQHESQIGRAQQLDGLSSSWRAIPVDTSITIEHALTSLRDISPRPDSHNRIDIESVERTSASLTNAGAAARTALEEAKALGEHLGVAAGTVNFEKARNIALAARWGAAPDRPEAEWFEPAVATAARDAVTALQPFVDRYRIEAMELSRLFRPELRDFDIERFFDNPQDLAPQIGKLNRVGQANRKQLKALTKDGKITDGVVNALPRARAWQRELRQLGALEAQHTAVLGTHYYQGTSTDFTPLNAALTVAETVAQLAGPDANWGALGRALGRAATDAMRVAQAGMQLFTRLEELGKLLDTEFPECTDELVALPFENLAEWCDGLASRYHALGEALAVAPDLGQAATIDNVRSLAGLRAEHARADDTLRNNQLDDEAALGPLYRGETTDWGELEAALAWASQLRDLVTGPSSDRTAANLLSSTAGAAALRESNAVVNQHIDRIIDEFDTDGAQLIDEELRYSLSSGIEACDALLGSIRDIEEWSAFSEAVSSLGALGLHELVTFCVSEALPRASVASTIRRAVLGAWVESVQRDDGDRLSPVRSADRERLVHEFQELDRKLVNTAAARVIEAGNARRPTSIAGQAGIITREAQKKIRHKPIRQLLTETGTIAQDCKPCFMMSPLSVSSFLPSSMRFDVVIFDEASQVRPCDAVNAIYRGGQLIVAGDERQLPPTSFFDRLTHDAETLDDEEDEPLDEFESVLKLCRSGSLQPLGLRWHYRSRHESLITFSNYEFYEGKLITYPGALETSPDLGVALFHVPEGVYQRGGARDNPIEAQRVVERVLYHATNHPESTLGVVAFSEAQASRIAYELEAARRDRRDLDGFFRVDRLDGFFVKNLENVQGDERDTMIFSIGYGRDEAGKFTQSFGPINLKGGGRRLNVAITRARKRVEVVSSIRSDDIRDTGNEGVRHLKRYLDFADRGVVAVAVPVSDTGGDAESPFEEAVLTAIRSWGYDPEPQVGHAGYRIDMAVRDPAKPGAYALGIECDGAMYHSSRVARDRDRLRQQVLEDLGWRLHRIWGPAWYRNRENEEQRLRSAIDAAIACRDLAVAPDVSPQRYANDDLIVDTVDFGAPPDWAVPYRVARPALHTKVPILEPAAAPEIDRLVVEVLQVEGPVSWEVCAGRVRAAFGQARLGPRIRDVIYARIKRQLQRNEVIEIERGFLAYPGTQTTAVRTPSETDPATKRSTSEVSWLELREAGIRLVQDARTIDDEALSVAVARLYRWSRTADVRSTIDETIEQLIQSGEVQRTPAGLSIA